MPELLDASHISARVVSDAQLITTMSSQKVLCITNDFGPRAGGIESFVIGLVERFPRNSVIVYTSSQPGDLEWDAKWLANFGVKVIRDRSKILLPTFRVRRNLRKIVKIEKVESVFFGAAAPLGLLAKGLRSAGVKKIVALTHGHEVWWSKVFPFNVALFLIGNSVDNLTYLGSYTKSQISRALSAKAEQAMVKIAPGIDTEHFKPSQESRKTRTALGIEEKKVIVSVGRLVHRKGQDRLIQALPKIQREIPNVHLLLVGQGPYQKHLEKIAKNLGVSDLITFVGRVQSVDLPNYICAGDIFAMPSRSRLAGLEVEGLGIVYLEASACGLPVLAGNSGGAPDAVVEGVTGFCVNGNDIDEIATKSVELLADSTLAKKMGEQGRAWVEQNWRWEIWSDKFQGLLTTSRSS
jgi:phosphatidylinositol alpha-1,6-mannosyltransferase